MKLKRTGLITKIVILILAVYAIVSLTNIHGRIDEARQNKAELEAERQSLDAGNAVMSSKLAHKDDEETIISIARESLNLVLPGETIYIDNGN